jgi:hypothetical protein
LDALKELFSKESPLCDELKEYVIETDGVFDRIIQHPLLIELVWNPEHCEWINRCFAHKQEMLDRAISKKDWEAIIWLHERPFRIQAFFKYVAQKVESDKKYWKMLSNVWTDSENQFEYYTLLKLMLTSNRKHKECLMVSKDRDFLKKLPETDIQIYRGYSSEYPKKKDGMSWTLDRDKAIWFANRLRSRGRRRILLSGLADKKNIHAYFSDRNESEIVIFPEHVRQKKKISL